MIDEVAGERLRDEPAPARIRVVDVPAVLRHRHDDDERLELARGDQPVEGLGGATERDPGALVVAESVQEVEHRPALAHRRRRGGPVQHVGDAAGKRAAWRVEPVFDLAGPRREGG